MFIIRKDLKDQGITTLEALTEWKRPDGRKPIISVSSLGGTNHVWASYYMEMMGLDQKVTWIGTGNVDTMLGALKTKQVDVLVSSLSLLNESVEQGWGALLFDGTDEAIWNKYIGGKVPVPEAPKSNAAVTARMLLRIGLPHSTPASRRDLFADARLKIATSLSGRPRLGARGARGE